MPYVTFNEIRKFTAEIDDYMAEKVENQNKNDLIKCFLFFRLTLVKFVFRIPLARKVRFIIGGKK